MENQSITPFLWFDGNAGEAIEFYCSVFKNSKNMALNRLPDGKVMGGSFELNGQKFMALNGGPMFKFNEAVSFYISCETQEEVDYYWEKLTADGGRESMCGWLKDKYGLSWQVVPKALERLLYNSDPAKANHAMQALMKMKKIVIKELE